MEAVFKFYSNGYGTVARTNPTIDHTNPSLALTEDGWKFKYKVNRDGSITLTQLCEPGKPTGVYILGGPPPGGFEYYNNNRNWRGTVSPDGKTIILNGGYPDIIKNIDQSPDGNCAAIDGAPEIVCNVSAVLIWQHDIRWGWNYDLDDDHCDDHRR